MKGRTKKDPLQIIKLEKVQLKRWLHNRATKWARRNGLVIEPLVETTFVEEMLARKLAHFLLRLEPAQAHAALHRLSPRSPNTPAQRTVARDRHPSAPLTLAGVVLVLRVMIAAAAAEDRSDLVLDQSN